jgi:hypothetical protein
MARISGRRGRLYVGLASDTAAAEPVAFLNKWGLSFSTDKLEVTAMGDTTKVYVAGLPDGSGTYGGFYDSSSAQLFTAAQDGLARRWYLYPENSSTDKYWFGTAFFDASYESGVGDAISTSGSLSSATSIFRVG